MPPAASILLSGAFFHNALTCKHRLIDVQASREIAILRSFPRASRHGDRSRRAEWARRPKICIALRASGPPASVDIAACGIAHEECNRVRAWRNLTDHHSD